MVVEVDGHHVEAALPARKGRLLLAYLAFNRNRPVRRDELIGALWTESSPADLDAALKTLLSRTRRALGRDVLAGRSELSLVLGPGSVIDIERAAEALATGRRAAEDGEWLSASEEAQVAVGIAGHGLLPGLEAPWIDDGRRQLHELELDALELVGEAGLALGGTDLPAAERAARTLVASAPFRETGYALQMRAFARRGNVAEAMQVYEQLRRLLREELGTAPSPQLMSIHNGLLRGVTEPVAATRPRAREMAPRPLLPPLVDAATRSPLVARDAELEQAQALLAAVRRAGEPQLMLVVGESGIGKTRWACEVAARAYANGAAVLYGRCDEDALLPYQPWVEALDSYVACAPAPELKRRLGPRASDLARLLPTLRGRVQELGVERRGDPDTERYLMFEGVAELLCALTRAQGGVLVLDDIQWSERPSLLLLRHILRGTRSGPLLVLGTYRQTDVEPGLPLADALADLSREHPVKRLHLGGLGAEQLALLIAEREGRSASPTLARALFERTEGNPFFAAELLDHLTESGAILPVNGALTVTAGLDAVGIPAGVKDVIGRRVGRLGAACQRMLAVGAVIGRRFDDWLLRAVNEMESAETDAALDEAVRNGLLVDDDQIVGRFAFAHGLIQETLYEGLSVTRRVRLHARIAKRLEELTERERETYLGQLAYHFRKAAPAGEGKRALEYAQRAGDHAMVMLAYEDAVQHYRDALDMLDIAGQRHRCELLLRLGNAQWLTETAADAPATFLSAARLAGPSDPQLLARAALGYGGVGLGGTWWQVYGQADSTLIELLREALAALDPDDGALRAQLLARLAAELYFSAERQEGKPLSRDAVTMARRIADGETLSRALTALHVALWLPAGLSERAKIADELVQLAEQLEQPELELSARAWRLADRLELGDIAGFDHEICACGQIAKERPHPVLAWYAELFRASRALVEGQLDNAEALILRAHRAGMAAQEQNATQALVAQLFALRAEQGRLGELLEPVEANVDAYPAVPAWRCGHAYVLAATGEHTAARSVLDELAPNRFRVIIEDGTWLTSMALLARACNLTDHDVHAPVIYNLLRPYAKHVVVVSIGLASFGPVAYHLGLLAHVAGRTDRVRAHFDQSLATAAAASSRPWAARTSCDYARALRDTDPSTAAALAREAAATARELGMAGVAAAAEALT